MKKKIIFSILLMVFLGGTFNAYPQTTKEKKDRLSLGFVFTPQFWHWYHRNSPELQSIVDMDDSVYNDKNGFSTGFTIEYDLNDKISLKSALLTSFYNYNTIPIELYPEDPSDPIMMGRYVSYSGSDHFIDLPLILKYKFHEIKRFSFFVGAGFINKFLFWNREKVYMQYFPSGDKNLYSKQSGIVHEFHYMLAATAEAGGEYSINDKFRLSLYPSFEFSLLSPNNNPDMKRHYYLLGINAGISYRF